jgi:hypothetical protein
VCWAPRSPLASSCGVALPTLLTSVAHRRCSAGAGLRSVSERCERREQRGESLVQPAREGIVGSACDGRDQATLIRRPAECFGSIVADRLEPVLMHDQCPFEEVIFTSVNMTYASMNVNTKTLAMARGSADPEQQRVVEMSYDASYDCRMPVLNFRTDERSERALAELMADGSSASDAIRRALIDAVRLRRREQMRIESLEMMNDEADRAESRKVLAEVDDLRAW